MTISIDRQKDNNESLQPKGWLKYLSFSLDHKVIGIQYMVCGFLFYLIGGTLASAIRIELASPMSDFLPRDIYNQFLTLHGTIMIFLTPPRDRLMLRYDCSAQATMNNCASSGRWRRVEVPS